MTIQKGETRNMSNSIKTVSDMFQLIEEENQAVKDGKLPLDTARVVQRGRSLQIKLAELNLQFQRVNKAQRGGDREFNLLTGQLVESVVQENKVV